MTKNPRPLTIKEPTRIMSVSVKTILTFLGGGITVVFGVEPIFIYTLVGLSTLDLLTGLIRAKVTAQPIHSRPLTDGMLKKVLPLLAIMTVSWGIVAIDTAYDISLQILNMSLALWFIGVEVKSNLENIQASGVLIPQDISKRIDKAFNTTFTKK